MTKMDEKVLVAPRYALFGPAEHHAFQGVMLDRQHIGAVLHRFAKHGRFMQRGDAEQDPGFKQLIPYCVLTRKGGEGLEVFAYKRLAGGGERRLYGRISLGVGGHMNVVPSLTAPAESLIRESLREIGEEVWLETTGDPRPVPIGLINDERDDVGRVHIGVLLELRLPRGAQVQVRELTRLSGDWMSVATLAMPGYRVRLEGWAQYALDALLEREGDPPPAQMKVA